MRYQRGGTAALEKGQGLVEYALALILVAVVVIISLAFLGEGIQKQYCQIVYSLDENANAPLCDAQDNSDPGDPDPDDDPGTIDVSCNIISTNPFKMSAGVSDNAGVNNIWKVDFYVDGHLTNTEYQYMYCLQNGDGSCQAFGGSSGSHQFRAVAHDYDGNVGECSTTANVP